ncbi:hypothetical protein I203_104392 [Kwoniella mangroviensis CBS 8507]|uniref:uncharacterized protein n=1 Tax=Kwoniella mangroviensis CBS 8507 TaxID=1296122 RepID=UPI00080D5EFB|nr:uncharacterized protein I203_00661 [Kwoniella mangroviensis CBS 8507]OCF70526.1 hypothetical protein I203_00661 [Kwoniella mangroviensis CBS 8507]
MSFVPKPPASHHHSASYTYGTSESQSQFASGVSQERSTASPTQPSGPNPNQLYNWPPKNPSPVPPLSLQSFVLPPLLSILTSLNTEANIFASRNSISSPSAHVHIGQQPNTMQQSHYSPTQTLPQVQPHYGPTPTTTSSSAPNMMLPPLRLASHNDPRINPPYASSAPPPLNNNHYGYSYPTMNQYSPYQRPSTYYTGGHITQNSTSSSAGSELWTPLSATPSGGYPMFNSSNTQSNSNGGTPTFGAQPPPHQPNTPSTIQPSAFPSWQPTSDLRSRIDGNGSNGQGTISPLGILGGGENSLRLTDRRSSTPGGQSSTTAGGGNGERWDRPSLGLSPDNSDRLSTSDEEKPKITKKGKGGTGSGTDEPGGNEIISFTTDAEVKQTPELKRMCFNCTNKSPPSWRKSLLHPGKILCNKCGIFERTHHKPRPPQNDDQKLRKQTLVPGLTTGSYRREIPPQLQVMRDDSDGSPAPLSPYSNVPSQATPVSATFQFPSSYKSPSSTLLPSSGPSSTGPRKFISSGMWDQTSPSSHSHLLNTPVSSLSATTLDGGDYSSSSPIRGVGVGVGYHGHGSSPYAHAYANRRTYSHPVRVSPIMPSSAGPISQFNQFNNNYNNHNINNGFDSPGNWNSTRRHSDVQLLPSLSSSSSANSLSQSNNQELQVGGSADGQSQSQVSINDMNNTDSRNGNGCVVKSEQV